MTTKCPTCHAENPEEKQFCGDCGTQLGISPGAPPSVTKTFEFPTQGLAIDSLFADRYQIVEQLGEGGMGRVYRAHDTQIDEDIAIKVLRPEIALDKRILERFRNELKFARKITHKSVCRMHDISVSDGTTYITMEYVEGEDLKSVIQRKGKLGIGQAMGVAMQIADGLVEAHDLGIIHRDLKPQNIMIDPEGNAKIMDFGIARSTQADSVTQEGSIIGTPEYMSPEQVEGRTVDKRSDIYSLAVILFEMLTGQVPFSGETVLDVALKHKTQKPDNPQQFNKKIPDALANLILRSMAKDPRERFQTAEELLKSLLSIEEGLPESERSAMRIVPRLPGTKAVPTSLKKIFIPTAAVAAIIVIALITWRLLFPPQPTEITAGRPTIAVLYFKNNTGDSTFDDWRESLTDMLTYDLMQSKLLNVVSQARVYSFLNKKDLLEARNYTVEDLAEFAEEVRATHFIQGFFTKSGENFHVSVNLQETKELRSIGAVDASGRGKENFATMVDELTPELKSLLGLMDEDIDNDFDVNIGDATTNSFEAYEFYVKAKKARAAYKGQEAANLMEKALALDPDFAEGYRFMARIHNGLWTLGESTRDKIVEFNQMAYDAMRRKAEQGMPVTEIERLYIEAGYYSFVDPDFYKAMDIYLELVDLYPQDSFGNHMLGTFYKIRYEDYENAAKHFEVVLLSGEIEIGDYEELGQIYLGQQLYKKAREIYRQGISQFPDHWYFHRQLAESYYLEGQFELALSECEKIYLVDPLQSGNIVAKGNTFYFMDDFQSAEDEYRNLLKREKVEERTTGRKHLITLYKLRGRFNDICEQVELAKEDPNGVNLAGAALINVHLARGEWEKADRICAEWKPTEVWDINLWKPYFSAVVNAELKNWNECGNEVERLNDILENKPGFFYKTRIRRVLLDLSGRIELTKENYVAAIDYLKQSKDLLDDFHHTEYHFDYAWYIEPLARAYYKSGELEKAREEYELITSLSMGRKNHGDIYAKSFYMLGNIEEGLGKKKEARRQYTRFLELWKDADPGLSEVEDAKKRLAGL